MAGNSGLGQVQSLMQMADAHLTISQQIQKPQPHRIGECLEKFD